MAMLSIQADDTNECAASYNSRYQMADYPANLALTPHTLGNASSSYSAATPHSMPRAQPEQFMIPQATNGVYSEHSQFHHVHAGNPPVSNVNYTRYPATSSTMASEMGHGQSQQYVAGCSYHHGHTSLSFNNQQPQTNEVDLFATHPAATQYNTSCTNVNCNHLSHAHVAPMPSHERMNIHAKPARFANTNCDQNSMTVNSMNMNNMTVNSMAMNSMQNLRNANNVRPPLGFQTQAAPHYQAAIPVNSMPLNPMNDYGYNQYRAPNATQMDNTAYFAGNKQQTANLVNLNSYQCGGNRQNEQFMQTHDETRPAIHSHSNNVRQSLVAHPHNEWASNPRCHPPSAASSAFGSASSSSSSCHDQIDFRGLNELKIAPKPPSIDTFPAPTISIIGSSSSSLVIKEDENRLAVEANGNRNANNEAGSGLESESARKFGCDVCGKRYKHLCNLKSHYKVHTDDAIVCPHCDKKFGRKANYREHLRIHTGECPYQCKFCQRKFKHHHSWKDHLRIHTGEKPYECNVCHKKFKVGHNLTVHLRIHTGEKPYVCSICSKSFRQKSAINSHMKRVHK